MEVQSVPLSLREAETLLRRHRDSTVELYRSVLHQLFTHFHGVMSNLNFREADGAIKREKGLLIALTIAEQRKSRPNIRSNVIENVADYYGITVDQLKGPSRKQTEALPRQVAMYILRTDAKMSYPKIGYLLGRDHSTVMHSCRKVQAMLRDEALQRDSSLQNVLDHLRRESVLTVVRTEPTLTAIALSKDGINGYPARQMGNSTLLLRAGRYSNEMMWVEYGMLVPNLLTQVAQEHLNQSNRR